MIKMYYKEKKKNWFINVYLTNAAAVLCVMPTCYCFILLVYNFNY